MLGRRIRRQRRGGGFELRLPGEERDVIRALVPQMRELLTRGTDPGLRRLYPVAYAADADADREYQALVHDDLVRRRLAVLEVVEQTLDATVLTEEQLLGWMGALNDMRLVLGTKLDVSEDTDLADLPEDDPDLHAYAVYTFLGWLLEQVLAELNP